MWEAFGFVVAFVLFAIGFAFGYRVGYREGDGVWRNQLKTGKGVAVDKSGALLNLSPEERASLDRAIDDFDKGKPARVKGARHGPR